MEQTKKSNNNQNYDERPVGELILIGNKFVHWTEQTHY